VTTIIEIKPWRNGWKVFEDPDVGPMFLQKDYALNYAKGRASFGKRVLLDYVIRRFSASSARA
jgi:hypothetical protein